MSPNALLAIVSTVARSAQCSTLDLFSGHRIVRRLCLKWRPPQPAFHMKVHRWRQVQHNESHTKAINRFFFITYCKLQVVPIKFPLPKKLIKIESHHLSVSLKGAVFTRRRAELIDESKIIDLFCIHCKKNDKLSVEAQGLNYKQLFFFGIKDSQDITLIYVHWQQEIENRIA